MTRAVGNKVGAFSAGGGPVQDVLDTAPLTGAPVQLVGSADKIIPSTGGNFMINSTGADAIVLPAPVSGNDDNLQIAFQDQSGHAHSVTSTGNLVTNSANVNTGTFSGNAGAMLQLRAWAGKWYVIGSIGITFS